MLRTRLSIFCAVVSVEGQVENVVLGLLETNFMDFTFKINHIRRKI